MIDHKTGLFIAAGALALFIIHVGSDILVFIAGYQFGKNGGKIKDKITDILTQEYYAKKQRLARQNASCSPGKTAEPHIDPKGTRTEEYIAMSAK